MESLTKVLFALLWKKGYIFIGERENTKHAPLPLFPTSLRSLYIDCQPSTVNRQHQNSELFCKYPKFFALKHSINWENSDRKNQD
ncbi:hypothetical protein VF06_30540 [Nostoc linckia z4]|nr:hypothetical protein VF02_28570 [Nostoc linckia z1]PHJ77143.1 hypothetical protein VF06_30540 [Nostoc linckia z4]PHK08779.1 hypothetical protein VF09_18390 [Nostoc linckia z9]PHK19242.1 hypothetical protein VF11_16450 [Nostoc linckia z14]